MKAIVWVLVLREIESQERSEKLSLWRSAVIKMLRCIFHERFRAGLL
jgi:hypothetical protein